jgi:CubicO group peptidase (beta-lactamase class C family)
MSFDVLGRVVEVVSGMSFDQFVDERIAKPLGLSDTGFYVSTEKAARVAEPQSGDQQAS